MAGLKEMGFLEDISDEVDFSSHQTHENESKQGFQQYYCFSHNNVNNNTVGKCFAVLKQNIPSNN